MTNPSIIVDAGLNLFDAAEVQKMLLTYEDALVAKVRIVTARGKWSIEDLWQLDVSSANDGNISLTDIAKSIDDDIRVTGSLDKTSDRIINLKRNLEIIELIAARKCARARAAEDELRRNSRIAELQAIIDAKQKADERDLTIAELQQKIDALKQGFGI